MIKTKKMVRPSDALTKLRGHFLGRDKDLAVVGLAGEYLTQCLLDKVGISWIKTDQSQYIYSDNLLRENKGKRPDYLIAIEGKPFFLDSKFLTLTSIYSNGKKRARIECNEVEKQKNTSKEYGIDTIYIIWERYASDLRFALTYLNEFDKNKEKYSGYFYNYIDIDDSEFTSINLG